ncbi:MAG: 3'-phosphoadenosine 5'-phosphosulfate sulfotransferase (PAPS reductase)/FAD synthetase [Myxococcota bacterium]|jgi:3'-phosphoadenosine 5'-phosphosulfate sulfotransferase (PAPS reductase)/FAD synthetase
MVGGFGPIEDLGAWRDRALSEIDGRQVVCSVSGGKDSTAMALLLQEVDIPFISVHLDTGWEHPDTDRYVRDYLPTVIGPIDIVQREQGGMAELVLQQAGFPGGNQRFCTRELKILPMRRFLDGLDAEPINTVGIRSGESARRAEMPVWDTSAALGCAVWRPLKAFSEADVYAMHRRHSVEMNPLYALGCSRVGCWPCVFARKSEIKLLSEIDPERLALIRHLENQVQKQRERRNIARGRRTNTPPTWFVHKLATWSIDEVIGWARSELGAGGFRAALSETDPELTIKERIATLQPEPFDAPPHEQGCMRWGLCELPSTEESSMDEFDRMWQLAGD